MKTDRQRGTAAAWTDGMYRTHGTGKGQGWREVTFYGLATGLSILLALANGRAARAEARAERAEEWASAVAAEAEAWMERAGERGKDVEKEAEGFAVDSRSNPGARRARRRSNTAGRTEFVGSRCAAGPFGWEG